jgi:membrane-bound lytic murein transglycosylase B
MYGSLASRRHLTRRTIARLRGRLRPEARANLAAIHDVLSLVHPVKHPVKVRVMRAKPAGVLLRYFKLAERRFHVSWRVLAAVNYIESKFGRVRSNSYAGAQGPMQFEPPTWRAYGMGGDVHDPHDAIMGAANYLRASGAPGSYRRALYAYDPAPAYVNAVLAYAHRMRRDPSAYYEYYDWQVFVRTRHGVRRLTGPGLNA